MFSCEGFEWWLPEDTNDRILGNLHYHYKDGLNLELKGSFKFLLNQDPLLKFPKIILGESENGKKITLCGCAPTGTSHSSFICLYAFIVQHWYSTKDIKIKKFFVNFTHLDEWLGFYNFNISQSYEREKKYRNS